MAEQLSRDDVEALFALIYRLRDQRVQTWDEGAELRAEQARRRAMALSDAREFAPAVGGRPPIPARGSNSLADHIVAAQHALDGWFSLGDPPAALPFASILFKLIGAEAEAMELAYLVVVCRHFGEEFGDRYRVLIDRATECGVYPVPELVDPEEPSAARAAPKGLFNDFSLDDDATGQTAEAPEAEWRLAPVVTPKEKIKLLDRTRHVPPPAGPLVDQTRLAREALYETRDRPARRGVWRLFGSLDR